MQANDPRATPPERSIIESEEIASRLSDLRMSHRALDDILSELGPAIGRKPELYHCVPGTDPPLHRAMVEKGVSHPELRIWFDYDDHCVYLVDIESVEGGR